jgi:predicted nucleotidyltransferase component of viral defense system
MNYPNAGAFRVALEQRLLNRSRESGTSLVRLRKAVVFDRLLARLVVAAPDRWVLKGALALDYRLGPGTRTTKDIDLGRMDDEEAATADFVRAQATDLGDSLRVCDRTHRPPRSA